VPPGRDRVVACATAGLRWPMTAAVRARLRTDDGNGSARVGRRYVTQVRVRWSDLDAFRHVNNAKTVTLLEEARVDWLFSEASRHGVDRLTEGIVVARLEIDYKRPIGMEVPVTVSMGLTKLGPASMTVDYVVSVAGTTAATASSVLVRSPSATVATNSLRAGERTSNEVSAPTQRPFMYIS